MPTTSTTCRATNRSECRYHGNLAVIEKRMETALAKQDFDLYETARSHLDQANKEADHAELRALPEQELFGVQYSSAPDADWDELTSEQLFTIAQEDISSEQLYKLATEYNSHELVLQYVLANQNFTQADFDRLAESELDAHDTEAVLHHERCGAEALAAIQEYDALNRKDWRGYGHFQIDIANHPALTPQIAAHMLEYGGASEAVVTVLAKRAIANNWDEVLREVKQPSNGEETDGAADEYREAKNVIAEHEVSRMTTEQKRVEVSDRYTSPATLQAIANDTDEFHEEIAGHRYADGGVLIALTNRGFVLDQEWEDDDE